MKQCCYFCKKFAFTLAEVFHPAGKSCKIAFTLAEVLITLGIIGVVAALTISSLVTNYQKKKVETRVKAFYSTMQQALRMAELDYGPLSGWAYDKDLFGNLRPNEQASYENNKKFIEKYVLPYLKGSEVMPRKSTTAKNIRVRLANGGFFSFYFMIYRNSPTLSEELGMISFYVDGDGNNRSAKNSFTFMLSDKMGIKPYDIEWNNSVEKLLNDSAWGCDKGFYNGHRNGLYCTKLLELNNWKIPSNYPWRS